ncbi:c-type cytochrome [Alphaproteobacteria bacterium KMM 3653]|uniref:C-type cytochrome n=1 Tax=Harenicola maris TaxID=2841044 RepID=A0AAP2CM14_9RHOB|nr:c-type cytochrome [Harenicola maris]
MHASRAAALLICLLALPAKGAADAQAGEAVFARCKACHSLEPGKHMTGPSLFGIIGAPSGQADFAYSPAMARANLIWDRSTLAEFLLNPNTMMPGTKMAFPGLRKLSQINDLIAFLATQTP